MQSPLSYWDDLVHIRVLLGRLLLAMAAFSCVRLGFIWYNAATFAPLDAAMVINSVIHGWRFDLSAVAYINVLFVCLSVLPIHSRHSAWYQGFLLGIFLLCNGVALGFELMDVMYFPFAFRRTGFGDFGMAGDFFMMLPSLVVQFWPLILSFCVLMSGMFLIYRKCLWISQDTVQHRTWLHIILCLIILALIPIGMRGGLQLRPLMPIAAAEVVDSPKLIPTVSNTTLTLIHSVQQTSLIIPTWFTQDELDNVFVPIIDVEVADSSLRAENVVIIVLESFGDAQISKTVDGVALTPFLDSLLDVSIRWNISRSNGLRSTEGIVSITTGLPRLMEQPFMFSQYQTTAFESIATHLNPLGYETMFFHGGNPGTMGFDQFTKAAGFDQYLDRSDFDQQSVLSNTYDGQWGIFDQPFFQYTAKKIAECDKKYAAVLFSMTSHYPYTVPEQYKRRYPHLEKQDRSIRYTDDALRQFFEQMQKLPEFEKTVFVLLADHVGQSSEVSPISLEGYSIPIAFYFPNRDVDTIQQDIIQQIDVMPSVLSLLGVEKKVFGFGRNVFQRNESGPLVLTYESGLYQVLDEEHLTIVDAKSYEPILLYEYSRDPQLKNDVRVSKPNSVDSQLVNVKARVQAHHRAMVKSALTVERYTSLNE